jgi:hypothetical protein
VPGFECCQDIFELLLKAFKASSVFEADGAVLKIDSSFKPNQPNNQSA